MIHPLKLSATLAAMFAMALASAAPAKKSATRLPGWSGSAKTAVPGPIAVLPGSGAATWLLPTAERYPTVQGDLSRSLVASDLMGDGTADVVVGNELSLTVGVLLSDRQGRVSEIVRYPIASAGEATLYRVEVAVGNLVGKRYADIVAAGFSRDTLEVFVGKSQGRFAEPIQVRLGNSGEPTSVAVADLNADGRQDIATSDGLDHTVSVLFGNGRGGFSDPAHFPTAAFAGRIVIADATGDGQLDILSAGLDAGVSLLASNGRGTFAAPRLLPAAPETTVLGLAVADATGDGIVDVVTANQAGGFDFNVPGSVSVVAGTGNGQFAVAKRLSVGEQTLGRAESVLVADVTDDGHPDIVAGRPVDAILTVLPGDGDGGFADPVNLPAGGSSPDPVVIADVTGDSRPDLITNVAVGQNEMVSILPAQAAGLFGRWGNFDTRLQINAESVVTAAFDRDGHPDVASVGMASDRRIKVAVQLSNGNGLSAPRHFDVDLTSATGITSADANADRTPDIIVVGRKGGSSVVSVLLGNGDGEFSEPHHSEIALNSQAAHAVAAADLNGDGHVDIATSNIPYACLPGDPNCSPPDLGSVSVLAGDGRGGFGGQIQIEGVADSPFWITAADATGDGHVDLVVPHMDFDEPGLQLLAGDGRGGFVHPVYLPTDMGPVKVVAIDATGDRNVDLISLNHTAQSVSLLKGDGGGSFSAPVHFPLSLDEDVANCAPGCPWLWPWAWSLIVGDIDADGAPDIASANTDNGTITVLRNDHHGSFQAIERIHTGGSPRAITLADMTADGKVDVVSANTEGVISVHTNTR